MRNDFAVFILTHGRPDNQKTLNTLLSMGYSGQYYLVLDNHDDTAQQYFDRYPKDSILVFDKDKYLQTVDCGMCKPVPKFAVFARNAIEDIARDMGYKYFMMLDDDIYGFRIRYDVNGVLKSFQCNGVIDDVILHCLEYMDSAPIACLMPGVCNMYRCGVASVQEWISKYRISVNCFIRNTDYEVKWRLNMFEDLITALDCNITQSWITFVPLQIDVGLGNGKVAGGNTDTYKSFDGFKMAFMPLMVYPSCNDIRFYKDHWKPITHANIGVNKIISDKHRKAGNTHEK